MHDHRPPKGFFVTGTDTDVGKTVVSCAVIRALRLAGIDTGAMKPVETGVSRAGVESAGPRDALALRDAAGGEDPLTDVCPLQFALPAAPTVAAEHEGVTIDIELLTRAFGRLAARHRAVVVEGAGGLLVPVSEGEDMADLAARFDLPLIVVARAALGTINHTLLTLEVARQRGLAITGVVISHAEPISRADEANLGFLRSALGETLIAEIPPLASGDVFSFPTAPLLPWLLPTPEQ